MKGYCNRRIIHSSEIKGVYILNIRESIISLSFCISYELLIRLWAASFSKVFNFTCFMPSYLHASRIEARAISKSSILLKDLSSSYIFFKYLSIIDMVIKRGLLDVTIKAL